MRVLAEMEGAPKRVPSFVGDVSAEQVSHDGFMGLVCVYTV